MDKKLELLIEVFMGRSEIQPITVTLRIGVKKVRVVVDFGLLRIPAWLVQSKVEEVEKKFECSVEVGTTYANVTPKVVEKILREYGYLSSYDDEHANALKDWFVKYFKDLFATLLKRQSSFLSLVRGGIEYLRDRGCLVLFRGTRPSRPL